MKYVIASLFAFTLCASLHAQAPAQPPLKACGVSGSVEVLCGTHSPEDIELTPDGKFLIVAQFVNGRPGGGEPGLVLFDIAAKTYSKLAIRVERSKDWGDASCPGPVQGMVPHGISLGKRTGGAWQLYVVNHGGRQSIEMFELKAAPDKTWGLIWRGCAPTMKEYNDVAVLKDGGFIATHPTALRVQGDTTDLFAGKPSGYVSRWSAAKGEEELPGTRAGYPNGVLVSADGRFMYFNAWTAREVHKYDLKEGKEVGMVTLDFLPDNITWVGAPGAAGKTMLAAGVKGTRGDCPPGSGAPCIQGFGVAEIDAVKMTAKKVFDSDPKEPLIAGVSVALQVGKAMYIGSFQGDRLVKIPKAK